MKRTISIVLISLICCITVAGQARKLRWSDGMCEFEGTYNAGKYPTVLLRNTLKLIEPGAFAISAEATAWKYEDIDKLDAGALDKQYKAAATALSSLAIVRSPYFEELRRRKLKELEQVYKLSRATILGYRDPAVLLEFRESGSCEKAYAEPLRTGGEPLLVAWRKVNEDSRARNADPDRLRRIFDEQNASPDRLKFARVEVMMFGWWNCANALIPYVEQDGTPEREFRKLFVRVRTIRCDEP